MFDLELTLLKRLLVVVLALLLIALGGGGWWWVRQSLPVLDGELGVPGLKGPVEVVFDGHAVPHVYARDPDDDWFAAGLADIVDRMILNRDIPLFISVATENIENNPLAETIYNRVDSHI